MNHSWGCVLTNLTRSIPANFTIHNLLHHFIVVYVILTVIYKVMHAYCFMVLFKSASCLSYLYIYIIARPGGQYGEIFSLRVVVLARLKGGTIQNQRTEYFPYCPTKGSAIIDLLYDLHKFIQGSRSLPCTSSFG